MILYTFFFPLVPLLPLPRGVKANAHDPQGQEVRSVAAAAERNRQKRRNSTSPAIVFTNDDVDTENARSDRQTFQANAPAAQQILPPNTNAGDSHAPNDLRISGKLPAGSKASNSEEIAAEDAEISIVKGLLAATQNDLDWRRRQLLLAQNTIYSNAAYKTTHTGKAKLDSEQSQIDQMQKAADELKETLANLVWRQWQRIRASMLENGSLPENLPPIPPAALVLPQP